MNASDSLILLYLSRFHFVKLYEPNFVHKAILVGSQTQTHAGALNHGLGINQIQNVE